MNIDKTLRDAAVLGARLALGGTIAAHGAQKLFGAFGGPGPDKAARMMHSLGLRPGDRYATMGSSAEMTSGALIALGALGPVGPAILASVMLVAIETVHRPKGYWASSGGYEMNVMYLAVALLLANHGYGSLSIDELTGLGGKMRPLYAWLAFGAAAVGAYGMLSQRVTDPITTIGETISENVQSPA
ncbi:MAG TPA: DoxX family protein [Candidatus Baltobacteraceae bacterium]